MTDKNYHIEGDTLIINNGVTTIDKADFHYLDDYGTLFVFDEIKNIQHIIIPESVKSIDDLAFYNYKSLESITIPNNVTSIGYSAFYKCTNLKSIMIPNSVTSIERQCFFECESLTNITIPDSVTSIGHCAFRNCENLTSITIPNSVTNIGDFVFDNCKNLTIACNKGSYAEEYAKDEGISVINNYIDKNDVKKAIETDIIGVYWNDEEESLMAGTNAVDIILSEDDFGEGEQAVHNFLAEYDTENITQMVYDYLDELLDAGDEGSLAEYDLWAAEIYSNLEKLEKSAKNKENIERD